ncbi:hypothetical protein D9615_007686 [Tricholomella constricta]|uniref:DUF1365-domain-containing protein n=1 Tax=Tricholomella constricta TaxID=117010 RepID=A0A8H5M0B3_9AGAR|nr:hypothetical protein D9615_007686 [Tricholomella constricta]
MLSLFVDAGVALVCLSVSAYLYRYQTNNHENLTAPLSPAQGYILENQVTHARRLPVAAAHAFTYPTLSLLVSLNALEDNTLNLGRGWLFGYGGIWGRLVGLRASPYFADKTGADIRGKLDEVLRDRGFGCEGESRVLEDAWMMTMPSFLGFEGINPLTVYFGYKAAELWLIVLEIHNTFGETHVHVLEIGRNEDLPGSRPKGFDHQWTFLREFHVSPFNDRSGFYTVSIRSPTHSPIPSSTWTTHTSPRPAIRVHLHTSSLSSLDSTSIPGPLKLTALLRPTSTHPLTTSNLLYVLSRAPFTLLLSLPRILAQAWTLHYRKRLDAFLRPEPLPPPPTSTSPETHQSGGGIKWLSAGPLERYARRRVEAFLREQVEEQHVRITIAAADPALPDHVLLPSSPRRTTCSKGEDDNEDIPHLVITYLAPRFFTLLFTCPSAEHALLLGCDTEGLFKVSRRELFLSVFSSRTSPLSAPPPLPSPDLTPTQRLRNAAIPASILLRLPFRVPVRHPLDPCPSSLEGVKAALALRVLFVLEHVERWAFELVGARVVRGGEPWRKWERAGRVFEGGEAGQEVEELKEWGSVWREKE